MYAIRWRWGQDTSATTLSGAHVEMVQVEHIWSLILNQWVELWFVHWSTSRGAGSTSPDGPFRPSWFSSPSACFLILLLIFTCSINSRMFLSTVTSLSAWTWSSGMSGSLGSFPPFPWEHLSLAGPKHPPPPSITQQTWCLAGRCNAWIQPLTAAAKIRYEGLFPFWHV